MKQTKEMEEAVRVVDAFADEHFSEERISQWVASKGVPKAVYDDFYRSELGLYCLPPSAGGKQCSFVERVLVTMQLMRRAGATLPFLSDMISMALLSTMSESSQKEIIDDFLVRNGRVAFSQAFSERGAGSDASAVHTSVYMDGDDLLLDGDKTFVSNGQFAPDTLVLANDPLLGGADGGMSLWLVPIATPGISTYPVGTVGQEMLSSARVVFDHVKLNPGWRIRSNGNLSAMLRRQYSFGRIHVCASSTGLARAALDDALDFAAIHMVKGQSLGSLPQIQEKLADMEITLRSMEALVLDAAEAVDSDDDDLQLKCSLMKRFVPKASVEVASEALQIFGGLGYTDAVRVGRIWRDCRGNQIAQGTDEIMVRNVAKRLIATRRSDPVAEELRKRSL